MLLAAPLVTAVLATVVLFSSTQTAQAVTHIAGHTWAQ